MSTNTNEHKSKPFLQNINMIIFCPQLDMDVLLFVDSSTRLPHMSRLSKELTMNKGGTLSVVNLDKEISLKNTLL